MLVCVICGKKPFNGSAVTHRGMLKKQGGVGRRTVRVNRRRFLPNLQRATILLNGVTRRARICTSCLKSGRVIKAPRRPKAASSPAVTP
ncbi:MAG: 50S ribosomal protein L28 [Candidatus Omnitrophica bacterium CG11_big_fil_rev_8_21_14_0_20_63_9]|nr:MAG: 50S ribosomal protein L28 [Candidatus Omnitrophica bacterium CG11_big_fil_rev_8_21_14_0_20_63_9]